jgi:uncharacterized phage-associated protein
VHGPAVMSVYRKFKNYGFGDIDIDIKESDIDIKNSLKIVIESVWSVYGKHKSHYLESLTHQEAPWKIARGEKLAHQNSRTPISLKDMKEYYSKKYEEK